MSLSAPSPPIQNTSELPVRRQAGGGRLEVGGKVPFSVSPLFLKGHHYEL